MNPRRRSFVATVVAAAGAVAVIGPASGSESAGAQKAKPACLGKQATIVGTARSNVITGTRRNDVIAGLGGNDTIRGLAGSDLVCGGPGADKLDGGAGADRLDGGAGADTCRTGERLARCEETRPDVRVGPLGAGPYVTDVFRPSFGFVLGPGWSALYAVQPNQLLISKRPEPGGLALTVDSYSGRQSVAATVARIAGIEGADAGAPASATVGGAAGQRFELVVTSSDQVSIPGLDDRYSLEPTDKLRVYAVAVRGVTVTILVEAPAAEFAAFAAEADEILASVRWR